MDEMNNDGAERTVHRLNVPQKDRTREGVIILITLLALFVLGYFLVGHPGLPRHAAEVEHAHHSMNRYPTHGSVMM